jgi:hypothetical protein
MRWLLYHPSTQSKITNLASCRVLKLGDLSSPFFQTKEAFDNHVIPAITLPTHAI